MENKRAHHLHPSTRLGAVKLNISDMERSLRFYKEVIGFQELRREGNVAELTADGRRPILILEEVPGALIVPPRTASGLYHFAILLPTRKDLGITLARLIECGLQIGQADHLVSEALYISDPDHNGIEIYRDRPREQWTYDPKGDVKMTSDPIDWDGLLAEAAGESWRGLPEGTTIGHVHFHVGDMEQARRFYCDTIGFDLIVDWMRAGALFISAGGYHHHIGLNLWAGRGAPPRPANGTGIDYFTIELPDAAEVEKTAEAASAAGYAVVREGAVRLIQDPFGITVRLVVSAA